MKTILLGQEVEDGYIADFITKLFREAESQRAPMEEIWNRCLMNYRSIPDKSYKYKYFIPETKTVIETVLPRITGDFLNKPDGFLAIEGRTPEEEERASLIKDLLCFVKDYAKFDQKFVTAWRSGLIYGTFFTLVYYEYDEKMGGYK